MNTTQRDWWDRRWRKTVDIKADLANENESAGGLAVVAKLRKHSEFPSEIVDEMEEAAKNADTGTFNDLLDMVYDIADAKRIWMGL